MPDQLPAGALKGNVESFLKLLADSSWAASELYRIPEDWDADKPLPRGNEPGVYCFVDADNRPLYIGKSESQTGRRICTHCGKKEGTMVFDRRDIEKAVCLVVLPIPRRLSFLAPALESYLIQRHNPGGNKNLRRRP
jgi:hypothetical protein